MRLDSRGMQGFVVSKELEIERVVLEMSLRATKGGSQLQRTESKN